MDALLSVKPGLLIWTLINFSIFLLLIYRFGAKPIAKALKAREQKIADSIKSAEDSRIAAQELLKETQAKIDNAQQEVADMLSKGRELADANIKKAADEADRIKKNKLNEAMDEIERSKQAAISELRNEVAGLVVSATEKILEEKLDKDKDYKLIDSYIQKLPNN